MKKLLCLILHLSVFQALRKLKKTIFVRKKFKFEYKREKIVCYKYNNNIICGDAYDCRDKNKALAKHTV